MHHPTDRITHTTYVTMVINGILFGVMTPLANSADVKLTIDHNSLPSNVRNHRTSHVN